MLLLLQRGAADEGLAELVATLREYVRAFDYLRLEHEAVRAGVSKSAVRDTWLSVVRSGAQMTSRAARWEAMFQAEARGRVALFDAQSRLSSAAVRAPAPIV